MEAQKELINNLLKERGMFNFKPFIVENSDEQLWGYCTQNDKGGKFHLCKSSLEEVPFEEFDDSICYFVIRVSEDSYSVLPEKNDISQTEDKAWLVNCEGTIINKDVQGYQIVGEYIILSPELENTSFDDNTVCSWNPSPKCLMFNINSDLLFDGDKPVKPKMYCASTSRFDIGYSDNHYFAFDDEKGCCQDVDSFLVYDGDVFIVNYCVRQDLTWEVYEYRGTRWPQEKDRILQIKTGIKTDTKDNCEIEWCCSHNYFALTSLQQEEKYMCLASWSWVWKERSWSWNGGCYLNVKSTVLCSKLIESDFHIARISDGINGIVVLEQKGRYRICDVYGNILADDILNNSEYAIITKSIPDNGHLITNTDDNYLLSGVLRMEDLSVVVPLQYQEVVIEATSPDLVVLMRVDCWSKQRYMMYKNGESIFSEALSDCELSKMESDKLVLVREGNKYDIVHKGERCLPTKYDMIEEIKPNVCLVLTNGEEKHLYILADKFLSRSYKSIKLIYGDYLRVIFIGDDSLIEIANEKEVALLEDCPSLELICSDPDGCYYIFEEDDLGFVCYSKWGDEIELEDYYSDNVDCYKIEDEDLWFVPEERVIVDNLWKYCDNDNDSWDNYDYEEDTYYALGGTDYEQFRENGGSIDDMMDGMGY